MDTPEFQIQTTESNGDTNIVITGELTVNNSKYIHRTLLKEAFPIDKLNIKIMEPEALDLSFLQILIAFIKSRYIKGHQTLIEFELGSSYKELIEKTGILQTIELIQKSDNE